MTDAELLALANAHNVLPVGDEQVALLAFAHSLIATTREEVFVIESGEYEQRNIRSVVSSLDDAVIFLKRQYGEPYIVTWAAPEKLDDDQWTITGDFTRVEGYCGDGPTSYEVTRFIIWSPI